MCHPSGTRSGVWLRHGSPWEVGLCPHRRTTSRFRSSPVTSNATHGLLLPYTLGSFVLTSKTFHPPNAGFGLHTQSYTSPLSHPYLATLLYLCIYSPPHHSQPGPFVRVTSRSLPLSRCSELCNETIGAHGVSRADPEYFLSAAANKLHCPVLLW